MNAKVNWTVRWMSVMFTLMASPLFAAGSTQAGAMWVATTTWGQFGAGANDARKEADELLKQARAALSQKKFDDAEKLVSRAEKLGVKYDSFTARFFETPEKIRKDLATAKSQSAPEAKANVASPALLNAPPRDVPPPGDFSAAPMNRDAAIATMTDDTKARAKKALDDGRKALEQGNVIEAQAAYQKALGLKASFGPQEYSPAQLAAELQKRGVNVGQLPPANAVASPFMLRPQDMGADDSSRYPTSNTPASFQNMESAFGKTETNPNNIAPPKSPFAARASISDDVGGDFAPAGNAPQRLPGMEGASGDVAQAKAEAQRLTAQAKAAHDRGDLDTAAQLIDQAQRLNVPDSAFAQNETRPWQVMLEINKDMVRRGGMRQAGNEAPVGGKPNFVQPGVYDPQRDNTRVAQVRQENQIAPGNAAERLISEGNRALEAQDRDLAIAKYQQAWRMADQLDPNARQQLKDKLAYLRNVPAQLPSPEEAKGLENANPEMQLKMQKMMREVTVERSEAERLANENPKAALEKLQQLRTRVAEADLESAGKRQMLVIVDRSVKDLEQYITRNRADIDLREKNTSVKQELELERQLTAETQNKVAQKVEEFNKLMEEGRYPEAEVIAKQVRELMPNSSIAEMLTWKSHFAKNVADQMSITEGKQAGFVAALNGVERSAIPFNDSVPLQFGDAKDWKTLSSSRRKYLEEFGRKMSPAEMEIQKALAKMVEVNFENRPLAEVLDTLSKMAGINIHIDPQGLHAEAVTSDSPVTLKLINPVSLKSALQIILGQLRLNYVIENEVLLITSQDARDSHVYTQVYYVADLVTPIPNFVPSYNIGLPGAIRESFNAMGYGPGIRGAGMGPIPLTMNQNEAQGDASQSSSVLAQMGAANLQLQGKDGSSIPLPMPSQSRPQQPLGYGPGGLGGGVIADFDTLIDLVTSTISPDSWLDNGGKGTISGFPTNLSLVVSQTQDIHQDIADLLQQLRRLQDLQVTIEVRFIALSDNFFERIGVDFDVNIDDNSGYDIRNPAFPDDNGRTTVFGLGPDGNPTGNLDLQYRANHIASAVPQFGGADLTNAATFGFAILSDIEVFFLLTALQGDQRTNVLQAPKVTLFNGQQAFVRDSTDRPFITQIIPVVGDFAAAHQPVVTVLSEGTSLSVQAVVSSDRRFVRLTLVPYFTKIGAVETFTFNGRTTSNSGTTVQDPTDPTKKITNGATTTTEGTTVQLPSLAVTTVSTTVSVPDGGTILLGGVKRLSEGRVERGVPLLSKVPYVSRLFKNTAIGRGTQSLMLMVTPRIIIQEEEEDKLGLGQIQ